MAGSPWPPFCRPEPYGPFGLVCSECGSRERNFLSVAPWGSGEHSVSSISSDHFLPPPPAFGPDWARLRVGPLAVLSLIFRSALRRVLGNSELRQARPPEREQGRHGA